MSRPLVDDLIHDILLRLRVKDVVRFRCLSNSLCTTIDSRAFVAAHHHRSVETNTRRRLAVFIGEDFDGYKGIDLEDESHNHNHGLIELNLPYDCRHYQILCSCNGLILIGHVDATLVLWNPFTRRSKKLPNSTTYCRDTYIGVGYDSATNDYKVVTLHPSTARVFHEATNTWSQVPIQTTFQSVPSRSSRSSVALFANGALHWLCYKADQYVYSFDISKHEFVNILPSTPPRPRYLFRFTMHVLGGRLLLGAQFRDSMELYEEAADDGDGNGSTWRKLYTIALSELCMRVRRFDKGNPLCILSPCFKVLELSNDGNKILLQYTTGGISPPFDVHLCWYHLQHQTFEDVDLIYRHDAFLCWESLDSFTISPTASKRKREIMGN